MADDVLAQRLQLGSLREQGVVGGQQGVGGVQGAAADRLVGVGAAVVAGRAARVLVGRVGAGGQRSAGEEQPEGQEGPAAGRLHGCHSGAGTGGRPALAGVNDYRILTCAGVDCPPGGRERPV